MTSLDRMNPLTPAGDKSCRLTCPTLNTLWNVRKLCALNASSQTTTTKNHLPTPHPRPATLVMVRRRLQHPCRLPPRMELWVRVMLPRFHPVKLRVVAPLFQTTSFLLRVLAPRFQATSFGSYTVCCTMLLRFCLGYSFNKQTVYGTEYRRTAAFNFMHCEHNVDRYYFILRNACVFVYFHAAN